MILDIQGLKKCFGGLAATANVNFNVQQGEIVGLIGPNGAGKTTLFNLISGSIAPDSGAIIFKGRDIAGQKPFRICRAGIARTFQSVKIFSGMSVFNHILIGYLFGDHKDGISGRGREQAAGILEFVGLSEMSERRAGDLTLASQKRLEVARALATRPELLLLDEVMAGLNPTEISEVMELVRKIKEKGITIIMIEHVMKAIMEICNRVVVLHHGEKLAEGKPEEITQNKSVIEVYLGDLTCLPSEK
ncbi:MAG: ABC transporter ATP-binding protein [Spirochaetes bacterium]|nr:ABC transporter ATP-binding protein [Spirochaetota bacterium]